MEVPFLKMHGTGNLILVVDQRADKFAPPGVGQLRELGDDATGPGFDQLMWIGPAGGPDVIASYRVFNSDGSEVEQCGNGVRCVARYLASRANAGKSFTLQSPAGPIDARVFDDGQVSVSMGKPEFTPADIPFIADAAASLYQIEVAGTILNASVLSMGNPHCVLQVADVDDAPLAELGPQIEHHAHFPQRTNVGFMHIRDRSNIDLRVHERGVGETAACGTGACAAVVAGQRLGLLDEAVSVNLPGGQVMVSWRGGEDPVWLKGNAELISEGTFELKE